MLPFPTRRDLLLAGAAFAVSGRPAGAAGMPRVVSMDYALAETLIAIGAPMVGLSGAEDWDKWVVEPPLPAAVPDVGGAQMPNYELLAALKPDLILTTPYLDPILAPLRRIATTLRVAVYEEGAEPLPRSIEATRTLGAASGREGEADRFLAKAEGEFDALARRVEALPPPPPLALVNFIDARHVRVYGGKGLYQAVLDRIGLRNAFTGEANYWGFATIGVERLAPMGEARLVSFEPVPPDAMRTLGQSPLWRELPFVQADRVSTLPPVLMFGGVPSALRFARLLVAELERTAA